MGMTAKEKQMSKQLGQILREGRVKSKMTQRQLAGKLGYTSPQYVSNWERGRVTPPLYTLSEVARFTHVPKDKIKKLLLTYRGQELDEAFRNPKAFKGARH
jgi:transcriptional regulator with XRE-family HTH domain